MEIAEEIENKVEENQISFDFLDDLQTLTKAENHEWVAKETLVFLADAKGGFLPSFEICGKSMIDWVALSTSQCQTVKVGAVDEEDVLQESKRLFEKYGKQEHQFVVLLFSDTPLLQKCTFLEIMKHFCMNGMNVLCLPHGFVFRAQWLKKAMVFLSNAPTMFGEDDFLIVENAQKAALAFKVLQRRILQYHKENGVILFGENTIFVDADVEIEAGAVIFPNNIIKGESFVGANAILESGNFLLDTIVCEGAFVCQSYLEKSKVEKEKVVGPFARLINQKV